MFEKSLNNEFVDTNNAVADTVNDFDDFYDDEDFTTNTDFASLDDDFNSGLSINNFDLDDNYKNEDNINNFVSNFDNDLTQLDFNSVVDGTPVETNEKVSDVINEQNMFSDIEDIDTAQQINDAFSLDSNQDIAFASGVDTSLSLDNEVQDDFSLDEELAGEEIEKSNEEGEEYLVLSKYNKKHKIKTMV